MKNYPIKHTVQTLESVNTLVDVLLEIQDNIIEIKSLVASVKEEVSALTGRVGTLELGNDGNYRTND